MEHLYDPDGNPIDAKEAAAQLAAQLATQVGKTIITTENGRIEISTVRVDADSWETKVFGGPIDTHTERWESAGKACQGHAIMFVAHKDVLKANRIRIIAIDHWEGPAHPRQMASDPREQPQPPDNTPGQGKDT